jgi:hypothetical protein
MAAQAEIAEIAEGDLEEVARFLEGERRAELSETGPSRVDPEHLRWFLFRNPAAGPDLPKGWLARAPSRF